MGDYVDARRRSQHKKVNWKTVEVVKQVTMDDYGAKKAILMRFYMDGGDACGAATSILGSEEHCRHSIEDLDVLLADLLDDPDWVRVNKMQE